jgi:repressor LexA
MHDKNKLSARAQLILDYLKKTISEKGYPPSIREICSAVGLKSTSSVHSYLEALESKGYIIKDSHSSRSIKIVDDGSSESKAATSDNIISDKFSSDSMVMVPVIGTVAAGTPILATEHIETYYPVPVDKLSNSQTFFLRVKGDSMVNVGIMDKDLVLVEQKNTADNGDIVVALIDDSATVKTFYREANHIRLQPENDSMEPIIVKDNVVILGKVIGDMRFF